MGDFKKIGGDKQRGGGAFHRGSGERRGFGGNPNFRGGDRGEREMFKAVCAECGKPCEVPFRPAGDRPVYCRECFQSMGGAGGSDRGDRGGRDSRGSPQHFQKRDFPPRTSYTPPLQGSGEDKRLDDLKIQLTAVISKLDKLLHILGNTAHSAPKAARANTGTLHDTLAGMKVVPAAEKAKAKSSSPSSKKKSSKKK